MNRAIVNYLYLLYSIIAGVVLGTFVGLFIIGTFINMMIYAILGYGDSGPRWVSVVIIVETIMVIIIFTKISIKWMRYYLNRKSH